MRVHLVCVFGSDPAMLPHLVAHYRGLGITSFRLIRHAESTADPRFEAIAEAAAAADVALFHTHVGPWHQDLNERLIAYALAADPDAWHVVVDHDEFHLYDRPLTDLVAACERAGADHVNGCFLDRVAADGDFPAVGDQPLWERYPLAGTLSATVGRALPLKTGLLRGRVQLLPGNHGTVNGRALPRRDGYLQVHHFKWTGDVIDRLRQRVDRFGSGHWHVQHPAVIAEARRVLEHIDGNDGRIGVDDPRLRMRRCGSAYGDYPLWDAAVAHAQAWQWAVVS